MHLLQLIDIVVLSFLFAGGSITTTSAAFRLCADGSHDRRWRRTSAFLLRVNLNIADLLIVYAYVLSELYERAASREWLFGSIACKFKRFSCTLAFHLCSNIVVCIAFERAYAAASKGINRDRRFLRREHFVIAILAAAWLLAIAISAPQIEIWDSVLELSGNSTKMTAYCVVVPSHVIEYGHVIEAYWIVHALSVSPVPLLAIAVCYAYVLYQLLTLSGAHPSRAVGRWRRAMAFVVLTYVLCWLPYNVAVLWSAVSPETYARYAKLFRAPQYLIAAFPILNPILYEFYAIGGKCCTN